MFVLQMPAGNFLLDLDKDLKNKKTDYSNQKRF
jgi:hypothetical protein